MKASTRKQISEAKSRILRQHSFPGGTIGLWTEVIRCILRAANEPEQIPTDRHIAEAIAYLVAYLEWEY